MDDFWMWVWKIHFSSYIQKHQFQIFIYKLCQCCDSQSKKEKKKLEFFSRDGFEIFTETSDFWICVLMEHYWLTTNLQFLNNNIRHQSIMKAEVSNK